MHPGRKIIPKLEGPCHPMTDEQRLTRFGYPVERINVTSEDGYILGLYRIPFSPKSPLVEGVIKKAVILHHGVLASGLSYLLQEGSRNLAMLLADSGFDVYIANARGNSYSQGHINPDMTLDNWKYWDFSFHEMGVFDLPAIIESVTDITKQESMYYVGHSMGSTVLAVMLSERPEYNRRIATAFLLAPAIFVGHSWLYVQPFVKSLNYYQYTFNNLLSGRLDGERLAELLLGSLPATRCSIEEFTCGICANLFFALFGYDGPQTNYTTIGRFLDSYPVTTSSKTMLHFLQMVKTNTFCQFNYGFNAMNELRYGKRSPSCYNLDNISTPLLIFWGSNDSTAKPLDIAKTVSHLPKGSAKENIKVNSTYFAHVDFVFAKDADILVYKRIVDVMLNATYG